MARPVTEGPPSSASGPEWRDYTRLPLRRLWHLLCQPAAGRLNHTLGATAGCVISVLVGEIWQIPMMELIPVMLLALWAADWMTNCILGVIMIVYFTIVMGIVYLGMVLSINNYFLILFVNLVFSYFFFFFTNASKLGILAMLGGLFMTFFLSDFDTLPTGNLATRALLYCWLIFALIGILQIGVSLVVSPSPEQVLTRHIAWRLHHAAKLLRTPHNPRLRQDVNDLIQLGVSPLLGNLFLTTKEQIFPAPLLNRLRQSAIYSFPVLIVAQVASKTPDLPAADRARYADLLDRMATDFQNNQLPDLREPPATSAPLLTYLGDTLRQLATFSKEPLPKPPQSKGFFVPDAFTNPDHVLFSLKGTLTIFLGILCYRGLNWSGIHTCVVTSFVAALPTMGEVIAKLNLRIIGTTLGALMAMGAIIWLLPHFISIAQLLLMFIGMTVIASWIQCGDPRISYVGMQMGIAIFLATLATFTPATNLDVPRDRIIGTFLGLLISYFVFTRVWPVSARTKLPGLNLKIRKSLADLEVTSTPLMRAFCAALTQEAIASTQRMLEYNTLEPFPYCPTLSELDASRHELGCAHQKMMALLLPAPALPKPAP